MSTALRGRDQVNVTFLQQLSAFRQPEHGPVDTFSIAAHCACEGLFGDRFPASCRYFEVIFQTIFVIPLSTVFSVRGIELDTQSRAENRFSTQVVLESCDRKLGSIKVLRVR